MFVCRVQPLDKEVEWTDEVRTLVESLAEQLPVLEQDSY